MPIMLGPPTLTGGEQLIIDPTDEDTGTELALVDNETYVLLEHAYPTPELDPLWASSPSTEGERLEASRYRNRVITVKLRVSASTNSALQTAVTALTGKVAKLTRERGTFRRILPSGDQITFDVESATVDVPSDKRWVSRQVAVVSLSFTCAPFGRGTQETIGPIAASTNCLIDDVRDGPAGDVPATVELDVTCPNGAQFIAWGMESQHYSATSSAAVMYEAEGLIVFSGAPAVGTAGAFGGGTNKVVTNTSLVPAYSGIITLIGSGNVPPTHVGKYRVFARMRTPLANTGVVKARLLWGIWYTTVPGLIGPVTTNPEVTVVEDFWQLHDLGLVTIPPAEAGTRSWYAQLEVNSTVAGDDFEVDRFYLMPTDAGYGELRGDDIGIDGATVAGKRARITSRGVIREETTANRWRAPYLYEGDYPVTPPAGAEGRSVRTVVLVGRGVPGTVNPTFEDVDPGAITLTMRRTPRYLAIPA